MASPAIMSRAQGVMGALRTGQAVKATACQAAAPVARQMKTTVFAPQRQVAVRSRRASTVTTAAANGTGLPIDLRGERRCACGAALQGAHIG
jgi:hypothetical protein